MKYSKGVGFFPQTVIHHSTVMGDGRRRRPVRFLLVRLRFIELFQRCLESMRDAVLHRSHRPLSDDDRDHVPLCQLLIEFAGTIEIAFRYPVALQSPCLSAHRPPARANAAWSRRGGSQVRKYLDCIEGLGEVLLALQGDLQHLLGSTWNSYLLGARKKQQFITLFIGESGANLRRRRCFGPPLSRVESKRVVSAHRGAIMG